MPTSKYNSLSPQDKCFVDAGVSEINRIYKEFEGSHFNGNELDILI
jgi:hypothetical protein